MLSLWRHPEVLYEAFALTGGALLTVSVPRVLPRIGAFGLSARS